MTLTTRPAGIVSAACSLQSLVAASPAKSELAEIVPQEKSPKGKTYVFCCLCQSLDTYSLCVVSLGHFSFHFSGTELMHSFLFCNCSSTIILLISFAQLWKGLIQGVASVATVNFRNKGFKIRLLCEILCNLCLTCCFLV